ncbi:MAG: helix-turn-helix transcriptional regulator, partial [Dehalococcoidales bacterium]|nr:helix-turn-helix transcriptional regulator [Dehalococcoidales bacterium]
MTNPKSENLKELNDVDKQVDICHLANYTIDMRINNRGNLGGIIRQKRVTMPLTLHQLAAMSGVSPSYLGRIEKGERFPSASILRKIASPLGFDEDELFILAGYRSPQPPDIAEKNPEYGGQLDPNVARVLGQEPVEVQRAIIGILTILKSIA